MPRVDNKGISIHYRVEGDGSPLVLLHGITDSSETWYERGYVAALAPKYRLILIDARGHGGSDKPYDRQSYAPETLASDVVAVLDDVGVKTAGYWGYSRGGWTGFAVARHALDRVTCFVIGGASASTALPFSAEAGKEDPLLTAFRGGPNQIVSKMWGEEWMTRPLRQRLLASDTAALMACQQQRLVSEGFSDVVDRITVPTLVYAGTADPIHDPARQSAAEIAGAQFVSLPGLNHIEGLCRRNLVLPHVEWFLAKALH